MAHFTRAAKPSSNWCIGDLLAFNISVTPISPAEFFQSDLDSSLDHLDPAILTSAIGTDNSNISNASMEYLDYLGLATYPSQECAIVDFSAATLKLMGFNERHAMVTTRYVIPLITCGEDQAAETTVCMIYHPTTVLLVLIEDKTLWDKLETDAQVVAGAIAAFQYNNRMRRDSGKPILEAMTIPCIAMFGTIPTFYLAPVTKELSDAVETARYPETKTRVLQCLTVAEHHRLLSAGMANAEYRKLAFKRFLAFRSLARYHWQKFLA